MLSRVLTDNGQIFIQAKPVHVTGYLQFLLPSPELGNIPSAELKRKAFDFSSFEGKIFYETDRQKIIIEQHVRHEVMVIESSTGKQDIEGSIEECIEKREADQIMGSYCFHENCATKDGLLEVFKSILDASVAIDDQFLPNWILVFKGFLLQE